MAHPDSLRHVFYEDDIPDDVERLFEKLYQSPFSVVKHFRIFRDPGSLHVLVISHGANDPVHALAYLVTGREVTVLNELVDVEPQYLEYFATVVFARYPEARTINFNRLKGRWESSTCPFRLWQVSQDIAIELPESIETYRANLGKQTRRHLTYYLNRLHRELGEVSFQTLVETEIDPEVIGKVIGMNRQRMKGKHIRCGYASPLEHRIAEFCSWYGSVSTLCIGDRLLAGAICYEVGSRTYLEAIAHDPEFNRFNVGQVCLYLTINHAIGKGKQSFHMLWGENEYKYRFLGVKHELFSFSVYRSRAAKLTSLPKLARHTLDGAVKQVVYLTNKYLVNRLCR